MTMAKEKGDTKELGQKPINKLLLRLDVAVFSDAE
jgi:hypothetical protein